ncbi:hypothetical protein ACSX1A_07915 [Pontibacter sp. MBLB2868]|uniref:hypothetical protein n=1 Tax=Pontibacter sp. MBLB2868 TaxID=3451555 RepID=UPI003F7564B1
MGNRVTKALGIVMLPLLLFSCSKNEDIIPVEQTVPLQVGNQWVYKVTDFDSDGNEISNSSLIRAVVKDTVIHGATWYILNDRTIVQNSASGYVYFNKFNRPGDEAVMIYQSASIGGIGYMYQYPNYNLWLLTTRNYELLPVSVAAGTFPSYTFTIEHQYSIPGSSTSSSSWQKDYVSPTVGLLRSDKFYSGSENLSRRQELVSYQVQ